LLDGGKSLLLQGRLDLAFEFLTEALAMFHQTYGPMHPFTAHCYSNLAMVSYHAGDIAQAIAHQKKAVIIHERTQGLDHHETAYGYVSLHSHSFKLMMDFLFGF
jgi:protein TIF31